MTQIDITGKVLELYANAKSDLGPNHAVTLKLRQIVMVNGTPEQRKNGIEIYRQRKETDPEVSERPKRRQFNGGLVGLREKQKSAANPLEGGGFRRRNKLTEAAATEQVISKEVPEAQQLSNQVAVEADPTDIEQHITDDSSTEREPLSQDALLEIVKSKPGQVAKQFDIETLAAEITRFGGTVNTKWKNGAQYAAALINVLKKSRKG